MLNADGSYPYAVNESDAAVRALKFAGTPTNTFT
jgi:VCBS repeat-containing protein